MAVATVNIPIPSEFFEGGTPEDAFHGTMKAVAQIIEKERFKATAGDDFFGDGVYFFEGDYAAAYQHARRVRREKGGHYDLAVIQASVNLGRNFYANLIGPYVEWARRELAKQLGEPVSAEIVFRLVNKALRDNNMIDSMKIVRKAQKEWLQPDTYRAEIILLVFDPERVTVRKIHDPKKFTEKDEVTVNFTE
jgi:hypothetical protein